MSLGSWPWSLTMVVDWSPSLLLEIFVLRVKKKAKSPFNKGEIDPVEIGINRCKFLATI